MRFAVVAAAATLALAVVASPQAQDPPADLGDTNLLVIVCDYLRAVAEGEGYPFKSCRLRGEQIINQTRAIVPVRVKLAGFPALNLDVHMQKSLWTVQAFS